MSFDVAQSLDTERLRLRPVAVTDIDALHSWQSLPEITRYLPYSPRGRERVAELLERLTSAHHLTKDGDRIVFAVELSPGGRVIGELHVVLRDAEAPECEIGWVFAPDVAGRGYATEGASAVIDATFAAGAHRIVADLDPRNTASALLCGRLGMRQEAHFIKNWRTADGGWEDTAVWAILNPDAR